MSSDFYMKSPDFKMLIASLKENAVKRILHPVLAEGPGSQLICYRVGWKEPRMGWDRKGLVVEMTSET